MDACGKGAINDRKMKKTEKGKKNPRRNSKRGPSNSGVTRKVRDLET